jgi:hypothetical protein
MPIPTTARSKAWVGFPSLAGIVVSNPTGGQWYPPFVSGVFSGRGLWDGPIKRLEESYRMKYAWV